MDKTSKTIRMLQILSCRDVVSKDELARALDTNKRNIVEYRKELEKVGYNIETEPGRYGGLRLKRSEVLQATKFTDLEKEVLQEGADYLNKRRDFLKSVEFNIALGKVFSTSGVTKSSEIDELFIDRYPLLMPKEELRIRYDAIKDAINSSRKIRVTYLNSQNKRNKLLLHPYGLFNYNMACFLVGIAEFPDKKLGNPRHYKLNRIESFEVLKDKFYKMKTFDLSEYVDRNGMKYSDKYRVKLLVNKDAFSISERVYGKNQTFELIDENSAYLICDMENKDMIVSLILGFGSKVKVVEPKEIKDALEFETKMISKMYESKKKTIIFDFNGTIIDDLNLCFEILNKMLTEEGLPTITLERYKDIFTFPVKEYYRLAGFDFTKTSFEDLSVRFINYYQSESLKCKLVKGFERVAYKLKSLGYHLVILSASKLENLKEQCDSFKITDLFDDILGTTDIYAKSKIEVGKDYLNNNNLDKDDVIMFGDTLHDLEVSTELGIKCILHTLGHQSKERLQASSSNVVNSYDEFFKKVILLD